MSTTTTAPRRSSRQSTPTSERPEITSLTNSTRKPSSNNNNVRPSLPKDGNPLMLNYSGKLHKVKLQTLNLGAKTDNNTITIARVKCPVPKGVPGHIIKRFDTNAVSASSLFRAAFPLASDEEEVKEMAWIVKGSKGKYGDTKAAGAESNEARKLSGTWIPAAKAAALAEEYNVARFATDLIAFPLPLTEGDSSAIVVPDSEVDSPAPAARTTKRQRVASPSALSSSATSGGVSILQTLSTNLSTGVHTETTTVEIETPGTLLLPSGEAVEGQIAEAKSLVDDLKKAGVLADLNEEITSGESKKRSHEVDEDEEDDEEAAEDTRGFFGRMFKKAPRAVKGRVPRNAGRIAVVDKDQAVNADGRRWIAGFGLAVAVGATAAAPYLFG